MTRLGKDDDGQQEQQRAYKKMTRSEASAQAGEHYRTWTAITEYKSGTASESAIWQ